MPTTSWHPYPPDVPADQRMPCAVSGCDRPAALIEVRSPTTLRVIVGTQETTTTVWCIDDARTQGYEDAPTSPPPAHLNAFQRWVVHTLGGDSPPQPPK